MYMYGEKRNKNQTLALITKPNPILETWYITRYTIEVYVEAGLPYQRRPGPGLVPSRGRPTANITDGTPSGPPGPIS